MTRRVSVVSLQTLSAVAAKNYHPRRKDAGGVLLAATAE